MSTRMQRLLHESRQARLTEAATMGSKEFVKEVERLTNLNGKWMKLDNYNKFNQRYDHVIITFINVPGGGQGAQAMNNRYQITVDGFGAGEDDPPPKGKVKAAELSGAYFAKQQGLKKMRAKTGTPDKIAKYVADYISKLAATETRG
jgi:hypothetical protein